jgi:wyosine [tRNA(Phe)-imidazoG37] synthetase (radical SAM superfamily)
MSVIRAKNLSLEEYKEFKDWTLKRAVTYGPFPTRRKGFSLGINVLPAEYKLCNFNCVYCQCGWSKFTYQEIKNMGYDFPSLVDIESEIEQTFRNIKKGFLVTPNNIVVSGNGEPTLHPQFDKVVDILVELRDYYLPNVPITILSNGTRLHLDSVVCAFNKVDERVIKLDAGSDGLLKKVDIPLEDFSIRYLVEHVRKLKDVVIQCCFIDGFISNIDEENIATWIETLRVIKPIFVQIYSIDRIPPAPNLKKVSKETLMEIALRVKKELDIEVGVY